MSNIPSKTIIKLLMSSLVCCNYIILCFGAKVQLFFMFGGIKQKFGRGVNSELLISYFMSILPYKMNFIKINGFNVVFFNLYSIKVLP